MRNLHSYIAAVTVLGGLGCLWNGAVLLGEVLVVLACAFWSVGYALQFRRLSAASATGGGSAAAAIGAAAGVSDASAPG